MTVTQKMTEIKNLPFMIPTYESCWICDYEVLSFIDSIKVIPTTPSSIIYYEYQIESDFTNKIIYYKKYCNGQREETSFQEIFDLLPIETQEQILFHLDLFT